MHRSEPSPVRIVGRYALYAEIASGGMATVHFGRLLGPVGFARTVAIKRLHPQYAKDPEFVSMFLDEARLAARIRHPNVVPTLDVVAGEGELFLVMEYIQGESLARLARVMKDAGQKIPLRVLVAIVSNSLFGLHAAHEAKNERGEPLNIVHRDVSPHNVLVGTDGVARVLDFGVAKAAGRVQTTREGQLKGKLAYMAPEQIHGTPVSRRTDVYATGVVLWEALTGQRLFTGENEVNLLTRVLCANVPLPSEIVKDLPPALDAVVMKALDRDPEKRFTSAKEMARELEKVIAPSPPSEVGEWVESIAGDALGARAERIAEIESSSASFDKVSAASIGQIRATANAIAASENPTFRDRTSAPTSATSSGSHAAISGSHPAVENAGAATFAPSENSQLSSVSVSRSGPLASVFPKKRNKGILVAAVLIPFAAVLTIALILIRHEPQKSTAAAVSPSSEESSEHHDPAALPALSTNSAAADSAPTASSTDAPTASATVATSASATATVAKPVAKPVYTKPATTPATTTAVSKPPTPKSGSCDPPYTLDALGHKHYKTECL